MQRVLKVEDSLGRPKTLDDISNYCRENGVPHFDVSKAVREGEEQYPEYQRMLHGPLGKLVLEVVKEGFKRAGLLNDKEDEEDNPPKKAQ